MLYKYLPSAVPVHTFDLNISALISPDAGNGIRSSLAVMCQITLNIVWANKSTSNGHPRRRFENCSPHIPNHNLLSRSYKQNIFKQSGLYFMIRYKDT
jgi:hypothetical protein